LKAFIKDYPDSKLKKMAYSYLGSIYRRSGTKEEAKEFYEKYTTEYPEDPEALNAYVSRIIRDKEDIDKGLKLGEKIEELTRISPVTTYMKNRAELYALKDDLEKAEEIYGERFIEGQVNRLSFALREYANFWVNNDKNVESALEMMDMAVKLNPDMSYIVQSAARLFCKLEEFDKALEAYGPEYIKRNMDNASTLQSYAQFWAAQKKNLENALMAAKKAIELKESHYNYNALSLVYSKLKMYDNALEAAEKAAKLAGNPKMYESKIKQLKELIEKENNN